MFVDLSLLILRRLGQSAPRLDKQIFPPAHLMHPGIIDPSGPIKGVNGPLPGLVMFLLYHQIDLLELIINLLQNDLILVVQHFLIFFHLHINMLDPFEFLLQHPQVILIIPGNVSY